MSSDLTIRSLRLDELRHHPENARRGNVELIAESLRAHGQYKPVVVQSSTGYVLAGNHTLKAARSLGWDKIDAVVLDVDDDEAKRIMLVDNRSSDMGGYDDRLLASILGELADESALGGTGFSIGDLEDAVRRSTATTGTDVLSEWEHMPDYDSDDRNSVDQVTVHFGSQADAARFFEMLNERPRRWIWWPKSDGFRGSIASEQWASAEASGE